jgi:DNA gyrase subunit A
MQLTDKTGDLACLKMTTEDEDLMLIRDDGTIIRMPIDQINVISRATQGVHLMRVDEGTRVVSVEVVPHQEEEEEEEAIETDEAAAESTEATEQTIETTETSDKE